MLKVLLLAGWLATLGGTVRLRDGKYEEVTVALSPHLDSAKASDLIDSLQAQFENASSILCKATEGRLSFRSLYVLVPRTWNEEQVNRTKAEGPLSRRRRLSLADIRIEAGSTNDVQQTKGCGQQGDFITLSAESILKKDEYFGRLLVSLWSRWRFGVFPEANSGFHYHPDEKKFIPNSCTDNHLNWTATQPDSDETCTPDVLNKDLCKVTVANEPNANITSSLLYKHDLPNMEFFCNNTTHNHFAETPQNLFCNGKSVMEVLQMSDDFKSTNINEESEKCQKQEIDVFIVHPNFKRIYVLLALENLTSQITESLTASLLIVVSQLLETGDEIVVLFNDQQILNVTVETNKDNTMNNITDALKEDQKQKSTCFLCSTYKLFQILNDTDDNLDPFVFVVTNTVNVSKIQASKRDVPNPKTDELEEPLGGASTTSVQDNSDEQAKVTETGDLTNLIAQLNNIYVTVDTVALDKNTDFDLEQLSRQTGGQSYYVIDDLLQPFLLEPLVNAMKDEDNKIEMLYHASLSDKVVDNTFFYADANFSGIRVFINNFKESKLIAHFHTNETEDGKKELIQDECLPIVDNSILILCNVSQPQASEFVLSVVQPTNPSNQSVNVFGIPNPNSATLQTSAWFSSNSPQVNVSKEIFVVYAKVHQGGVPHLDATVNAKFTTDNGVQFQISLQDDGIGADLHKNDGIYSGQVSDCSQTGRFLVSVNVINKCYNRMCDESTVSFQRNLLVGSVIFTDCKPSDKLEPSFPVRDLTLKEMKDGNATFSWTQTSHQSTKNMTLYSLPHWSNEAKIWTANGIAREVINNTVSSFGSTRDLSVNLPFDNEEVLFIALITGENDDASIASNILTVLPNSTEESTTAIPQTAETKSSGDISESTISLSTQKISEPSSGTSDAKPTGGATETGTTKDISGSTVSSNDSSSTTEDASPISDAVSGSSKSAAAGIIAVVVLVSVGGLIASTYYFAYYRRRVRHDPSYSVGYSNLE